VKPPAAAACTHREACPQGRQDPRPLTRKPDALTRGIVRNSRGRPPSPAPQIGMQFHTADGIRKYLTADERDRFLRAAEQADRPVRTLCMTLTYAGCRLSEALALTADRADLAAGVLVFESLKKRRAGIFRSVPVPPALLDALDMVHGIRERHGRRGKGRAVRLWPWSRMTGWRAVHAVMQVAGLDGVAASPKGCGTVLGWPPSLRVFRSIWCRTGSAMRSSAPLQSMPTPSATRRRTLRGGCGIRQ
jgi:integrase/recombinase XerD